MSPKQGVFQEIQRGIETENRHQVVTQVFRVKAWALVAPQIKLSHLSPEKEGLLDTLIHWERGGLVSPS